MSLKYFILFPTILLAQPTNIKVLGVTQTQAIISYSAPSASACTYQLSTNGTNYTIPVSVFSGGGASGVRRIIVGSETVALEAGGNHKIVITCGTPGELFFSTKAIQPGGPPKVPLYSVSKYGGWDWPSPIDNTSVVDPMTGLRLKAAAIRSFPKYYTFTPASIDIGGGVLFYPIMPSASTIAPGRGLLDVRVNYNCASSTRGFALGRVSGALSGVQTKNCTGGIVSYPASGFSLGGILHNWSDLRLQRELQFPIATAVTCVSKVCTITQNLGDAGAGVAFFPVYWEAGDIVTIGVTNYTIASVTNGRVLTLVEDFTGSGTLTSKVFGIRVTGGALTSITVDVAYEDALTFLPANGGGQECSPIQTTLISRTGVYCLVKRGSVAYSWHFLFFDTLEFRQLGQFFTRYAGDNTDDLQDGAPTISKHPWSSLDPKTIYFLGFTNTRDGIGNTNINFMHAIYRGNGTEYVPELTADESVTNAGNDVVSTVCLVGETKIANLCIKLLSKASLSQDPLTVSKAYDSRLAIANSPFSGMSLVAINYPHAILQFTPIQDALTIYTVYNIETLSIERSFDTFSYGGGRFGVAHTSQDWWAITGSEKWIALGINPAGSRNNTGSALQGPFRTTFVTGFSSGAGSACPANSYGMTTCVSATFAGPPCYATPDTVERAMFPCPGDVTKSYLGPFVAGDFIGLTSDLSKEILRIVSINGNVALLGRAASNSVSTWADGASIDAFPSGISSRGSSEIRWVKITGAVNVIAGDAALIGGHFDIRHGATSKSAEGSLVAGTIGSLASLGINIGGFGRWALGDCTIGTYCPGNGRLEEYPSLFTNAFSVDLRPRQGGTASNPDTGTPGDAVTQTLVSGSTKVYKVTSPYTFTKSVPWIFYAGAQLIPEKSAPGFLLGDSDAPGGCIVHIAGECVELSSVGDIYIAVDKALPNATCRSNHHTARPFCASPMGPIMNNVVMQSLNRYDYFWQITQGLQGMSRWQTYSSARMFGPILMTIAQSLDGIYSALLISKPNLIDSGERRSYAGVTVQGGGTAYIEFGYNSSFHCGKYQSACRVASATIDLSAPYKWAHESITPISGPIIIPAEPGRILYYRRVSGGVTGATQIIAIP